MRLVPAVAADGLLRRLTQFGLVEIRHLAGAEPVAGPRIAKLADVLEVLPVLPDGAADLEAAREQFAQYRSAHPALFDDAADLDGRADPPPA